VTIIRDLLNNPKRFIEFLPEIIAGIGFIGLIIGLSFSNYDETEALLALRFIIGGGLLLISGILLAIERKIPSSSDQSSIKLE